MHVARIGYPENYGQKFQAKKHLHMGG